MRAIFTDGLKHHAARRLFAEGLPAWAAEIGCAGGNQVLLKFVSLQPAMTYVIPGSSSPKYRRENAPLPPYS